MNDGIKEILDYLKDEKWDYYPSDMTPYKVFLMEERDKILDYITNLQQELEEYKDTETYSKRFLYKANKDRLNANLKLVEENERLKLEKNTKSASEIICENLHDVYKSRIEKAVEILKRYTDDESNYYVPVFELIDILNGEEKENG